MYTRPFYIHRQTLRESFSSYAGFSVKIVPLSPNDVEYFNERMEPHCYVAHTLCSLKEKHFVKSKAREALETKAPELIRVKDLPSYLCSIEDKAWGIPVDHSWRNHHFDFVLKYFI